MQVVSVHTQTHTSPSARVTMSMAKKETIVLTITKKEKVEILKSQLADVMTI